MADPRPAARVLVVEDEPDIADLITRTLERGGDMEVDLAMSGEVALEKASAQTPAVIVLDLNLPVLDGLEVCRILRTRESSASVPIIMLTARTSEGERIRGLDLGADDYITKPFSPRELAARVRAALRRTRTQNAEEEPNVVYKGRRLTADFDAIAVSVDGVPIRLTRREFELLRCLIQNRNRVLSRDRLLERVWGYERSIETRAVDVHVARLRGKLGAASRQIETLVGLGYRFVD
ncbi:MAG: response regulator transcription factor [Acidobacteria bacterium]|nr:response regulator transcription factor [Acidobacteriota bacterium]